MNYYSSTNQNRTECPDELIMEEKKDQTQQDGLTQDKQFDKYFMSQEDLRKEALDVFFFIFQALTKKYTGTN